MKAAVLDGIVLGLQFGLLGVGLTLVYGLGGVLNLAYGQFAVLAAMIVALRIDAGSSTGLAVISGLVAIGFLALAVHLTLMRPVYRQEGERRVLLGLLLMLGVAFVIEGLLVWKYPTEALSLRVAGDPVSILGVPMRRGSLLASAIAIAIGSVLLAYFRWTTSGKAVRSVIQDREGAQLCGVNPASVRALIFVVSGVLAGIVAVTTSMSSPVTVSSGFDFTVIALIVAVVGGLGSISGAFLAGLLLGIVDRVTSFYIGSYITTIVLLAAAALTLVLRPSGLLGHPE